MGCRGSHVGLSRQTFGQNSGCGKGYDTGDFVDQCRALNITPHVAAKKKHSQIDGRTTSTAGYGLSQIKRKRIEQCSGWMKDIVLMKKLRHCGQQKVAWIFRLTAAAYNIVRLRGLLA